MMPNPAALQRATTSWRPAMAMTTASRQQHGAFDVAGECDGEGDQRRDRRPGRPDLDDDAGVAAQEYDGQHAGRQCAGQYRGQRAIDADCAGQHRQGAGRSQQRQRGRILGGRQQNQAAGDGQQCGHRAGAADQPGVVVPVDRRQCQQQRQRGRRDPGGVHPGPVLAQLHRQSGGREREHEADEQQIHAVGEHRRQTDERHQHQQRQMLGVPSPGQGQPRSADDGGHDQPDRCRHPLVDGHDRDDVQVGGGNTGGGQRNRADPAAGPTPQPGGHADEGDRQRAASGHPDLRSKQPGLRGQHEQQHHADQRYAHPRDGEHLADPAEFGFVRIRFGARSRRRRGRAAGLWPGSVLTWRPLGPRRRRRGRPVLPIGLPVRIHLLRRSRVGWRGGRRGWRRGRRGHRGAGSRGRGLRGGLGKQAVQLAELAGYSGHLTGQRVEFVRKPTEDSTVSLVRFGHGVPPCRRMRAIRMSRTTQLGLLVEPVLDGVTRQLHPVGDLQLAKRRLHMVLHCPVAQ